jgi:hypothetical protein
MYINKTLRLLTITKKILIRLVAIIVFNIYDLT